MKKIYILAGEPSGDLHGAHLVEAMKNHSSEIQFRGFGGHKMAKAGVALDQTIDRLSFMGFSEVVRHFPDIFSNFRKAKKAIREWNPDAIVYIDFPGFNMRMAKWAHKKGYTNFYYIAPQAWAWKERRALKLKRDIDELFCILPFEKSFFARFEYDVHYVGHPLVDIIRKYREDLKGTIAENQDGKDSVSTLNDQSGESVNSEKIIALLPGSRQQEVMKILPEQLNGVLELEGYQVIVGKSSNVSQEIYDDIATDLGMSGIAYEEDPYPLLDKAYIACVASGTATLETALFKVPEVVCFKGSLISYFIARRLIKVQYISLVNLIMNREVVKELIQDDLSTDNIHKEIVELTIPSKRKNLSKAYEELEEKLGVGGAAEKTAKIIISKLGS